MPRSRESVLSLFGRARSGPDEATLKLQNRLNWLAEEVPELAQGDVAVRLAMSPMTDDELYAAAVDTVDGAEWRQQVDYLKQAPAARQRAEWDALNPHKQQKYLALGYTPPTPEQVAGKSDSWIAPLSDRLGAGFSWIGDQVGTGLQWMENLTDTAAERPSRAINHMQGWEQMALQLGLQPREARLMMQQEGYEYTPDQWIKMFWTYAERNRHTFKALGGDSDSTGLLGTVANIADPAVGMTYNENPFKPVGGVTVDEKGYQRFEQVMAELDQRPEYQQGFGAAWGETAHGTTYISPSQRINIQNVLNKVPDETYELAVWLGQGKTTDEWVQEREQLDPASEAGRSRIRQLETDAMSHGNFQDAVEMAAKYSGSTTAGRLFADSLGMEDTGAAFTAVSGMTDAVFQMALDPTLAGGKVLGSYRGAKWGIKTATGLEYADDVTRVQRFWQAAKRGGSLPGALGPAEWTDDALRVSRGTTVRRLIPEESLSHVDDLFDEAGHPTRFLEDNFDDIERAVRTRADDAHRALLDPTLSDEAREKLIEEGRDAITLRDVLNDTAMPVGRRSGLRGAVDAWRARAAVRQGEAADMIADAIKRAPDDPNALPELLQKMPHLTDSIDGFFQWNSLLRTWGKGGIQSGDDIFDFYRSHLGATKLLGGRATPSYLSQNAIELPRFTRGNAISRWSSRKATGAMQWAGEAGQESHWITRQLTRPVRGTGKLLQGLTKQVPRNTAIQMMEDGSYWLDTSSDSAVSEFMRMVDFGSFLGVHSMDEATKNRYITDFILGATDNGAAANMSTRRMVIKNLLRDQFDRAGVAHANPDVKKWADDLIERFDSQAFGPGGIDELPIGTQEVRSPIFPDTQFSPMIEIPSFRDVQAATRKTNSLTAWTLRKVNNPLVDAYMANAWKPAMLLRAGFIPRAAGEELLSMVARHGLKAIEAKLVTSAASEHGTLLGTVLAFPTDVLAKVAGNAPHEAFRFREAMRFRALAEDAMTTTGRLHGKAYWDKLISTVADDYDFIPNWADRMGLVVDQFAGSISSRVKRGYFRLGSTEAQTAAKLLTTGGVKAHAGRSTAVYDLLKLDDLIKHEQDVHSAVKRMFRSVPGAADAQAQVAAHDHFLWDSIDETPSVTSVLKGYKNSDGRPMDLRLSRTGGFDDLPIDEMNDSALAQAVYDTVRYAADSHVGRAAAAPYAGLMTPDRAQELGALLDLPAGVADDLIPAPEAGALGGLLVERTPTGLVRYDPDAISRSLAAGLSGPEADALTGMGIDPQRLLDRLGPDGYQQFLIERELAAERSGLLRTMPGKEASPDAIERQRRATNDALDRMGIEWDEVGQKADSPVNLADVTANKQTVFEPDTTARPIGFREPRSGYERIPDPRDSDKTIPYAVGVEEWKLQTANYWGDTPIPNGIELRGPMQRLAFDPDTKELYDQTLMVWGYGDGERLYGFQAVDLTNPSIEWLFKNPDATGPVANTLEAAAEEHLGKEVYARVRAGSQHTASGRKYGLRNQSREAMTGQPIERVTQIRDMLDRGVANIDDLADSEIEDILTAMGRPARDGEVPRDVLENRAPDWLFALTDEKAVADDALRSVERIDSELSLLPDDDLAAIAKAYGIETGRPRQELLDDLHGRVGEDLPIVDRWQAPDDPSLRLASPESVRAHLEAIRSRFAADPEWRTTLRRVMGDLRSSPSGAVAYSDDAAAAAVASLDPERYPTLLRYLDSTHPGSNLERSVFKPRTKGGVALRSEEQLDDLELLLRVSSAHRGSGVQLLSDAPIRIGRPSGAKNDVTEAAANALGDQAMQPYVRNMDRYNVHNGQPIAKPPAEYERSYYSIMLKNEVIDRLLAEVSQNGTANVAAQLAASGIGGDDLATLTAMLDELDAGVQGAFVASAQATRTYQPLSHFMLGNYDDAERMVASLNKWAQGVTKSPGKVAEVGWRRLPDAKLWPSTSMAREALLPADDLALDVYRAQEWVASGARPYLNDARQRFNDLGELDPTGAHVVGGGTFEEALRAGADPVQQYIDHIFVQNDEVVHELLEPALNGDVTLQLARSVPHDRLPKELIARTTLDVDPGWWQKAIRKGFDGYIAPAVSALVRNPMLTLNLSEALKGTQVIDDLIRSTQIMDAGLAVAKRHGFDDLEHLRDIWHGIDDATRDGIANGADLRVALENFDTRSGLGDLLDAGDTDLDIITTMLRHDEYVEHAVVNTAMGRAVRDTVPYIDDHNVRSFFQEYARNLMPFQFAQEQFLKRWARTMKYDPAAAERMRLIIGGFSQSVLVHENERGEKAFYIPMSEQLGQIMAKVPVVNALWGQAAEVPISVPLSGELGSTLPGIPSDFQRLPSLGPIASIPTQALRSHFPEFRPFFNAALGSESDRSIVSQLMPSWLSRGLGAATNGGLGFEQELNAATIGALQQMEAEATRLRIEADEDEADGLAEEAAQKRERASQLTLADNATAADVEHYLDSVRQWARSNMATRAFVGFFSPAPAQTDFDTATLAPEFVKLMEHHPIEEALALFLTAHPEGGAYTVFETSKPSGAPLPAVREAGEWMTTNREWMEQFPLAAPWMLPQLREGTEFDRAAYNDMLAVEMRQRKAPDEWYADLKFASAARDYFNQRDEVNAAKLQAEMAGDLSAKSRIDMAWQAWSTSYRNRHPLFAEQLTGEQRTQRLQALEELRLALNDPAHPEFAHEAKTVTMIDSFDAFKQVDDQLKNDQRDEAQEARERLKQSFSDWGERFIVTNPEMTTMWRTLFEPAAGLRDDRVARQMVLRQMTGAA